MYYLMVDIDEINFFMLVIGLPFIISFGSSMGVKVSLETRDR